MVATIATFNDVLKEYFLPGLVPSLNNASEVWKKFKQGTTPWHGRNWNMSLKVTRNDAIDYTDGTLPALTANSQQGYARLQGVAKRLYGRVDLDALIFEAAKKGGNHVIVDWARGEMDGLVEDIVQIADQHMVSGGTCLGYLPEQQNLAGGNDWEFDGDLAKVAQCMATGGGTLTVNLVQMDTYANIVVGAVINNVVNTPAQQTVQFVGAVNNLAVTDGFLTAVVVTEAGVIAGEALAEEPIGIFGNLSLPAHHGVDRTTATGFPVLQSSCISQDPASGAARVALTRGRLKRACNMVYRASGTNIDEIWMPPEQIEAYEALTLATANTSIQVSPGTKAAHADAGVAAKSSDDTGLSFDGIPIKRKRRLPPGVVLGMKLTKRGWFLEELRKGSFESRGGGILQPVDGDDSFRGMWKAYHELVCPRPNAQFIIGGLTLN